MIVRVSSAAAQKSRFSGHKSAAHYLCEGHGDSHTRVGRALWTRARRSAERPSGARHRNVMTPSGSARSTSCAASGRSGRPQRLSEASFRRKRSRARSRPRRCRRGRATTASPGFSSLATPKLKGSCTLGQAGLPTPRRMPSRPTGYLCQQPSFRPRRSWCIRRAIKRVNGADVVNAVVARHRSQIGNAERGYAVSAVCCSNHSEQRWVRSRLVPPPRGDPRRQCGEIELHQRPVGILRQGNCLGLRRHRQNRQARDERGPISPTQEGHGC